MNAALPKFNVALAMSLVVLYVAWWLNAGAPARVLPLTALLFAVVPLLLLAPSIWRAARFGTSLAGFIVPFHFAFAVMELIANPQVRGWVAVQTFLSLLLLVGVMATLRQVRGEETARSA